MDELNKKIRLWSQLGCTSVRLATQSAAKRHTQSRYRLNLKTESAQQGRYQSLCRHNSQHERHWSRRHEREAPHHEQAPAKWREHYTACHEEPGRPAGTPTTEGRERQGPREIQSQDHELGSKRKCTEREAQ